MTDEKWSEILDQIEESFGILERKVEKIPIEDDFGVKGEGTCETVIFNGAAGKMKLERKVLPVILEKKVHYKKTKGMSGQIEYILSPFEKSQRVIAYKWNENLGDWQEIDTKGMF